MKRLTLLIFAGIAVIAAGFAASLAWFAYAPGPDNIASAAEQTTDTVGDSRTRDILYYRNPMGLPDTSPTPKKDSMGMDYIPVYADEMEDGDAVKISPARIQRSGVKTETAIPRTLTRNVRGIGTIKHDESKLWVVTVRSDGYVEDLFVNKTGQKVVEGQPLFRFYSSQIQLAQADLLVSMRAKARTGAQREIDGSMQKLRNLGVPQSRIEEVRKTKTNPRTLDWGSPATGHVVQKNVIEGQRVEAGDELFRIANHKTVWVITEVAEADIADIEVGTQATVTLRAFPNAPHEGKVTFIYPEMLSPQTRTVPVRIELPNEDGQMRPGMYADVVLRSRDAGTTLTVPADAVIDSGERKVVFVAKGDGRFEPREVTLGRKGRDRTQQTGQDTGRDYVEVLDGIAQGEDVVTAANFLIGSESNLNAALKAFNEASQ